MCTGGYYILLCRLREFTTVTCWLLTLAQLLISPKCVCACCLHETICSSRRTQSFTALCHSNGRGGGRGEVALGPQLKPRAAVLKSRPSAPITVCSDEHAGVCGHVADCRTLRSAAELDE